VTDVQPSVDEGSDPERPARTVRTERTDGAAAGPAPDPTDTLTPPEDEVAQGSGTIRSFRVMHVEDVTLELPSQYPSVTLIEAEPPMRALVFPVGLAEGAAMAQAIRRMTSRRPMTHELFMEVLQKVRIDVISLRVIGREEGNLVAELDLMTPSGAQSVDCRPSDGLVLALRMPVPAPILVDERLLDDAGDVEPYERRSDA
jgi:bifunctional DNase/RNase